MDRFRVPEINETYYTKSTKITEVASASIAMQSNEFIKT